MEQVQGQAFNEWLVIRCQQGEEEAFASLVERWHRRYYLYALKRLGNRDAALDATQDCLLSISRSLHQLNDPATFPKWSFRILERRCVDSLRRLQRDRKLFQSSEDSDPEGVSEEGVGDEGVGDEGVGDDSVEASRTVEELLARLDPRLALVLRLYYLEELTIDEIAEICGLPAGTVKSRLYYARKLMAGVLTS